MSAKVFVVDANPVMRLGIRTLLSAASIRVLGESGDGDEALLLVEDLCPDRDAELHVGAVGAVLPASLPGDAAARLVHAGCLELAEVTELVVCDEHHVAAAAAVAPVRAPLGHVLLAPERGGAVSAVAGFDPNSGAIDEHAVPTYRVNGAMSAGCRMG